MYFLIADTHMGHENICRYCNRPKGFEKIVMERWQRAVQPKDVVIHLGDLAFEERWVAEMGALPGRKILLRGNHDRFPIETYLNAGWIVMESMVLKLSGIRIVLSHRPMLGHAYDINIHGHQHDLHVSDEMRLYFPVALEHTRYAPVAMTEDFLKAIRSFAARNHQPSQKKVHTILGSNRELEERDFFGGFGKEANNECRRRIKEGYDLLSRPETARASRGYRLWHFVRQYAEGEMDAAELQRKIRDEIAAQG